MFASRDGHRVLLLAGLALGLYPASAVAQLPADLSIATDGPATVNASHSLTYTAIVTNLGPSVTFDNILVDSQLPAGATGGSGSGTGWTCGPPDGLNVITCSRTDNGLETFLPDQALPTLTFAMTAPAASGDVSFSALVTSLFDFDSSNDTASTNTTVLAPADLSITKIGPSSWPAGLNLVYLITVTNGGPGNAQNVTVTDVMPTGTATLLANPSQGSCSGTSTVTCTLGSINNGTSATVYLQTQGAGVSTPPSVSNTASVSAANDDPDPANNSATVNTIVTPSADLAITKSAAASVVAGQTIVYTITATNNGPSAAAGVSVADTLPAGTTFVSATPSQGSCSGTSTVTCSLGSINNGTSATVTVTVSTGVSTPHFVSNTATGSTTALDLDSRNNSATATTTVTVSADLVITKIAPSSVVAGQTIVYTITATNNGPSAAAGVSVADTLPAGTTFVSATPSQGSCSGTSTVTCSLGSINNGASATVTLTVSTTGSTPLSVSNTATGSTTTSDPAPGNNSSTANTTVTASADLAIGKSAPSSVVAGQNIVYTITATNNGPSTATGVSVVDALPTGTTFVSATPTQGSCSGTSTVTCSLGSINNGVSATVTLTVSTAGPAPPASVSNTATVSSTTSDPASGNNTATANTTLAPACAGIAIAPAALPPAFVGSAYNRTFTLTNGVAPVSFVLTGALPSGLSFSNGALSGVPMQRGSFAITVEGTDANNCRGAANYAFIVSRPHTFAAGAGAGGAPTVRTFGLDSWTPLTEFNAYAPGFAGGVSVALGDTNGDGVVDVITGAGPGGDPNVRVVDGASGLTRLLFMAYGVTDLAGVEVAAGDVNGDGFTDIVTVLGPGGGPVVRAFDGRVGTLLYEIAAMTPALPYGLHVGAGDVTGDGLADIVVGAGFGGSPTVQIFDGGTRSLVRQFSAYVPEFTGGVYVAAGDVTGDGFADIITGAGPGGAPHVRVFDGVSGLPLSRAPGGFFAYAPIFQGGVRVAASDLNGDGYADLITGAGPGGGPHVRVFDGLTGTELFGLYAFDEAFHGGAFVAGAPPMGRMAIDVPPPGAVSTMVRIAGWALEENAPANTGPGTDAVHAWAYPVAGGAPVFVGAASARTTRPDVAAAFGGEFAQAGFDFTGTLAPGTYDLVVFVRNATTHLFDLRRVVRITVQ